MSGYKIKFNGLDRIYSHYKAELDAAAKEVWRTGNVLHHARVGFGPGDFLDAHFFMRERQPFWSHATVSR